MVGLHSVADYSPFGVELDGRTQSGAGYRYSFQGQEKDDEIKGEGNSINYKYRMHDPRVGRFFAVDPLIKDYPYYSSYSFSGNKLIAYTELEGMEEKKIHTIRIFNLDVEISFRRYFKFTPFKRIGIRIYKNEDKSPNPDQCWKFVNIPEVVNVRVEITENIRASHVDLVGDMGSSNPPNGVGVNAGIVTRDFFSNKEHKVIFDPHGDADRIRIIDLNTGAVLKDYDGVLRQEFSFGTNTPIRVELTGRGTHSLEVWEQQYEKETTTRRYENGKLVNKDSNSEPTNDLPGDESPKEETEFTINRNKRKKVECDCDEAGAKKR